MPRRCRPRSVTGLYLVAISAMLAFAAAPAAAQTATGSTDLLQPSLSGNPANQPTFAPPGNATAPGQAPPTGRFTAAPSRIGTTPVYGSPTGFGAGDTGFDSSNRSKKQRTAKVPDPNSSIAPPDQTFDPVPAPPPQVSSQPPVLPPPLPPEVYPAKAASRRGAVLPPPPDQLPISNPPAEVHPLSAANRPGAVLPIPPAIDFAGSASTPPPGTPLPNTLPLGTPSRPPPVSGVDPYAALGIKAGSFLILPSLELSGGYDNNPAHVPNGPGSPTAVIAPELQVQSDWSRHSFTADIVGTYYWYGNDGAFSPPLDRPYLNSKLDGRIDVTRETQILLENRVIVSTDNPGSPNIAAGLAKLPIDTTIGQTVGVEHEFGRFDATLKGSFDRTSYQDSQLTDGTSASNATRNYDQTLGLLRLGYEIDPGVKPYVEVSADRRVHDVEFDSFGEDRDSTGLSAKVGATLNLVGSLTGEIAVGYMERDYRDPTLPNIGGPTLDGTLTWQMTALTAVKLTAASVIGESTLQGVSGEFSRDVNIEVDHAFRTWLIGTAQIGYGNDNYMGISRDDNRYFAALGVIYKLNRTMQIKAQVRHDWLTSTQQGNAYEATAALLTLRLQR